MAYSVSVSSPRHPARKEARKDFNNGKKSNPYSVTSAMPSYLAYEDEWKHLRNRTSSNPTVS